MLAEFNGDILSNNQRLIALDVSHNQITTLKLDEVNIDCSLFIYHFLPSAAKSNLIDGTFIFAVCVFSPRFAHFTADFECIAQVGGN